jgi:hypothetical protein
MGEPGISPRHQVAQNLADVCIFCGLNDHYGVNVTRQTAPNGKTYWNVTFCKDRLIDGALRVYSPNFILVEWNSQREVMKGEAQVRSFLVGFL